ncbi:hypothetical protein KSP40_PGU010581 [Platanthera guangdongensis]|uniref:Uncharacterized protein n=1 Tax=Platanthera guangdongensis TaxID=2320717 RepID=A0ABR2MSE8_9ASPA
MAELLLCFSSVFWPSMMSLRLNFLRKKQPVKLNTKSFMNLCTISSGDSRGFGFLSLERDEYAELSICASSKYMARIMSLYTNFSPLLMFSSLL